MLLHKTANPFFHCGMLIPIHCVERVVEIEHPGVQVPKIGPRAGRPAAGFAWLLHGRDHGGSVFHSQARLFGHFVPIRANFFQKALIGTGGQ
jgi:hypothetical protein